MNTLITPAQVLRLAFGDTERLTPPQITEGDIAAAEQRWIIPVVGRPLYEKILAGDYPELRTDYLTAPAALFTRLLIQPRLDIRTGQCGTTVPRSVSTQPADDEACRRLTRSLLAEARTLLRRASEQLAAHRADFPEYDPEKDIFNRCTADGGFVQLH